MNDREFDIAEAHNNNAADRYFEAATENHARELRAYEAKVANLVEALRGVIRVADRDTDEFDAAKAAILNAVGE